jgi:hypothetical protein
MKKIFAFYSFCRNNCIFSTGRKYRNDFNDKISIRAIELYDNKVWYSGSDSKFGFVDLKDIKIRSR